MVPTDIEPLCRDSNRRVIQSSEVTGAGVLTVWSFAIPTGPIKERQPTLARHIMWDKHNTVCAGAADDSAGV